MVYQLKGVFAKVSVEWKFQAPPGGGDTHYSLLQGTKCDIVIRQGAEEKFQPTVYIENVKEPLGEFTTKLKDILATFPYDSLGIGPAGKNSLKIVIPAKYRVGHEEHFAQVTAKFLEYLKEGRLPEWEVPNMIAKYYTTTSALRVAKENK
jgi:hypothetical protein